MRLFSTVCLLVFSFSAVSAQETGTILVANMSDDTVTLIDAATRTTVATLPSGPAPHEIAVSSNGKWAVVTNYGNRNQVGSSLTLIDVAESRVHDTFHLDIYQRPHGIAFLPGDTLVVVTSEVRQAVIFVDIRTGEITGDVGTTQRASHMLGADRTGRKVFVTNIVDGTITEIDGVSRQMKRVIDVAPMVEGIAVAPAGDRVWIGSNAEKSVYVLDAESGEVDTTFTGFGFPYRMAVAPDGSVAVLADPGRSEIRIVDASTLELLKTIKVSGQGAGAAAEFPGSASPEGLVITPDSRYAYVSLQGLNRVAVVDLVTQEIIATPETGAWPDGIGYSLVGAVKD